MISDIKFFINKNRGRYNRRMKLSAYAKKQGVSYRTAVRWVKEGKIPCRVEKMPSGTIIIHELDVNQNNDVVIYARVSTYDRKQCLDGQVDRCTQFAFNKGLSVKRVYKEIASGMNDERKKLWKMLDSHPSVIIVENKDRLTRFGFNYLRGLLKKQGCEVVVINEDAHEETDLMKDMIAVITSFCCRLYGARRGQNKASKIKQELISNE